MNNKILWVEDESFMIKGLFRPLEKLGFEVDVARSAIEAYHKIRNCIDYDVLVVDLIIPLSDDDEELPEEVNNWNTEKYIGVGLAKWLATMENVRSPILLLSVVANPIKTFRLDEYRITHYLSKNGLLPSKVTEEIVKILGITEA